MSNLSVKHSRPFSPAKLRYLKYDRAPAPAGFRLGCKDESLNRNPLLQREARDREYCRGGFHRAARKQWRDHCR